MWRPNTPWPSCFLLGLLPGPSFSGADLVDQAIGREGQELVKRVVERHVREQRNRLLEAAAVERLRPDLALDPLHLAGERLAEHRRRHVAAVVELRLEMQP